MWRIVTCSLVSVSHESSGITPYIKSPLQQHMAEVRTQHRLEHLRNVIESGGCIVGHDGGKPPQLPPESIYSFEFALTLYVFNISITRGEK